MPKSDAVWGIDLGQCALKALRCRRGGDGGIVADAFDYIEYPKILSQPEADREELVREALEQFLSRNNVAGDQVAISVSGQSGLSRFFKPPPVDAKKLGDIVKYEARQQIPFALEDVIWDWEQMGGQNVDGFIMDAEIGLFAMKRDAVFRALRPFTEAGIEIDYVQLAPITVYNVICKELLPDVAEEDIDPENPPESIVVMSMGTETTDLIITNGVKMWQRSIPLGGNHFTKQLTKELKLTYAKAEHLKRNARQAEDPKTVFQAMRPVFNDLVTEVQRSINFFQSMDRKASIGRIVMLGNAVKLPGLRQYLSKNLGSETEKVDSYEKLSGAPVVSTPSFKENINSFAVCYGLCLQGLNEGKLTTNLLPREFLVERLIRDKKPWALASVGALLLALSFNFYFHYDAWSKTRPGREEGEYTWGKAMQGVQDAKAKSDSLMNTDAELEAEREHVFAVRDELLGADDREKEWLELTKAIDVAIPKEPGELKGELLDPEKVPFKGRKTIYVHYIESEHFDDLNEWFNAAAEKKYRDELDIIAGRAPEEEEPPIEEPTEGEGGTEEGAEDGAEEAVEEEPVEEEVVEEEASAFADETADRFALPVPGSEETDSSGWVIEIEGHHYHNGSAVFDSGIHYVRRTLMTNLREMEIRLPGYGNRPVKYEDLGIGYVLVYRDGIQGQGKVDTRNVILNPNHPDNSGEFGDTGYTSSSSGRTGVSRPSATASRTGTDAEAEEEEEYKGPVEWEAPRYDFIVQFVWRPQKLRATKAAREQEMNKQQPRATGGTAGTGRTPTPSGAAAPGAAAEPDAPTVPDAADQPDAAAEPDTDTQPDAAAEPDTAGAAKGA